RCCSNTPVERGQCAPPVTVHGDPDTYLTGHRSHDWDAWVRSCWQMSTSDPQARRRTTPMGSPVMAKRSPACPMADSTACDLVGKLLSRRPRKVTDQPCSAA